MSDAVIKVQRHMDALYHEHTKSLKQQHSSNLEWLHGQLHNLRERLGVPCKELYSQTLDAKANTFERPRLSSRKRKIPKMEDVVSEEANAQIDVLHDEITELDAIETKNSENTIIPHESTNQDSFFTAITETTTFPLRSSAAESTANVNAPDQAVEAQPCREKIRIKLNPSEWKVVDLRRELKKKGFSMTGLKAVLLNRLEEALTLEAEDSERQTTTQDAIDSKDSVTKVVEAENDVEGVSDRQIENPDDQSAKPTVQNQIVVESELQHDMMSPTNSKSETDEKIIAVENEKVREAQETQTELMSITEADTDIVIEQEDLTSDLFAGEQKKHSYLLDASPTCAINDLVRESDPGTELELIDSEPQKQSETIEEETEKEPEGIEVEQIRRSTTTSQTTIEDSSMTKSMERESREFIRISGDLTSDDEDTATLCIRNDINAIDTDSVEKLIPQKIDVDSTKTIVSNGSEHAPQLNAPKECSDEHDKVVCDPEVDSAELFSDRTETPFQKETQSKVVKEDAVSEPKASINHSKASASRKVVSEQMKITQIRKESGDRQILERRFNIEREVLRIRMAAKKSAQQRYERAKANKQIIPTKQLPEKSVEGSVSEAKADTNQKEMTSTLDEKESIKIRSPIRATETLPRDIAPSDRNPSREAIRIDCVPSNTALQSVSTKSQIQKPSNLVSSLHSFVSLLESKTDERPKTLKQNSMQRSIPPVSALKKAEKVRELEHQRKLEKAKRLQALRRKHEQERAIEDARKERKLQLIRDRTSRKPNPKRVVDALKQAKRRHEKMQARTEWSKNGLLASSTALPAGDTQPKQSVIRLSQNSVIVESSQSDKKKQSIPSWARKENLERIMHNQFQSNAIDPSPHIFPDFVDTCDLEKIFDDADARKKKQFTKRNSSGNWMPDRPNAREKSLYRREMGFKP